jgi:hypothetical protein
LQTQEKSVLIEAPVANAAAKGSTNVDVGCSQPQALLHGQTILIHAQGQEHMGINKGEQKIDLTYFTIKMPFGQALFLSEKLRREKLK